MDFIHLVAWLSPYGIGNWLTLQHSCHPIGYGNYWLLKACDPWRHGMNSPCCVTVTLWDIELTYFAARLSIHWICCAACYTIGYRVYSVCPITVTPVEYAIYSTLVTSCDTSIYSPYVPAFLKRTGIAYVEFDGARQWKMRLTKDPAQLPDLVLWLGWNSIMYDTRFHWSTLLSFRSNWSDRTTGSGSGSRPWPTDQPVRRPTEVVARN